MVHHSHCTLFCGPDCFLRVRATLELAILGPFSPDPAASSFKGVGAIDNPYYQDGEDPEEMEKSRKRDIQLRMADQAKKDKAKAQKAADLSNQQKADVDEYIDRMTRRLSGGKMSSTLSNASESL